MKMIDQLQHTEPQATWATGPQGSKDHDFFSVVEGHTWDLGPQPSESQDFTVSPSELSTGGTSISQTFSDIDQTPLFEDAVFSAQDTAEWTSLFEPAETETSQPQPQPQPQQSELPQQSFAQPEILSPPVMQQAPAGQIDHIDHSGLSFADALAFEVKQYLKKGPQPQAQPAGFSHLEPTVQPQSQSPSLSKRVDKYGITMYQRKPRLKPLKPVDIPVNADPSIQKRARNTEAARRSRARKSERMSQLDERVSQLVSENEALQAEIARLRKKCGESALTGI